MIKAIFTIIVAVLGFAGVMILALAYSALSWGFVMYKFWNWFLPIALPTLTLPQLQYYQAIALVMFIELFKTTSSQVIKKEYKDETAQTIMSIVAPWVLLGVGYFVYVYVIPKVI